MFYDAVHNLLCLGSDVDGKTSFSPIRSLACSVVCLMSKQDSVRREVAESGAIPSEYFNKISVGIHICVSSFWDSPTRGRHSRSNLSASICLLCISLTG